MRNLVSLRHLHFNDPDLAPAEVRFLTRLQTLSFFVVGPDHMVEELGCLNELKGELKIHNLEQVRDKEEAGKAKLCEKRMNRLVLKWSDEGNNNVNYEGALEGLQPHPDIRSLTIGGYGAWEEELKCPGGSTGVSSAGVGERVPCCGVHVVSKVLASRLARLQKEATCAEMGSCVNQKGND
ncbi:DISEASE RESISTANCE PROTEIN RP [Salix purpurea]|uniref:DISEASE RESISTANCE PROTEIN RP n=1 Tax=Salix purpurea TaxID=77065 RepID=A0A9Q0NZN7_SALPP|nr:DISEASE RESISTANCE PROTEIN RP [Salix purpurea]